MLGYGFDLVSKITKKNLSISSVRVNEFCTKTQFNATKLNKEFRPPFTLQEGLDKTLKFEFLKNK